MDKLSIPAAILGFQGLTNTTFAIYGLLQPDKIIAGLEDAFGGKISKYVAYTSSLQLLNMGILTIFTAQRRSLHRQTLIVRLGLHLLASYLFWQAGPQARSLATADIVFAGLNLLALPFVKARDNRA